MVPQRGNSELSEWKKGARSSKKMSKRKLSRILNRDFFYYFFVSSTSNKLQFFSVLILPSEAFLVTNQVRLFFGELNQTI